MRALNPHAEDEELLEDLHDRRVLLQRRSEPMIPLAEVKRRLAKYPRHSGNQNRR